MSVNPFQQDLIEDNLKVPQLTFQTKTTCGHLYCILDSSQTFGFCEGEAIPNRRTRPATIYKNASGKTILETTTKADKTQVQHLGIVYKDEEKLEWLKHSDLTHFEETISSDPSKIRDEIAASWANQFQYKDSTKAQKNHGLRPPQLGALHRIAAHWSIENSPATIVMPTGTGKTETMLSLLTICDASCMLVIVPSDALRKQTAEKFKTLGILPQFGILPENVRRPVVGVIENRIKTEEELAIFDQCNVVITTPNAIAQGTSVKFLNSIAQKCSHLIFDEAHHVAASSWQLLKEHFIKMPILQFTATPFREDKSSLGAEIIFSYPLSKAQADGYFKPIQFRGVFEVTQEDADIAIATEAINKLREDLAHGHDHRLLARCKSIPRAKTVLKIYEGLAPDLNPILVNSKSPNIDKKIQSLRNGDSKIVVTVNMLSEGFDLPELKVAAIHDPFKSLAVTLQFAGRFPRVSHEKNLGDPYVVANTGDEAVSGSLQLLYDEDPNWDKLLSDLSFTRVEQEDKFNSFLQKSQDLSVAHAPDSSAAAKLTPHGNQLKFNTTVYKCDSFSPLNLERGLEDRHSFVKGWNFPDLNATAFVTHVVQPPGWTKSKAVDDSTWELVAMFFDDVNKMLHIFSSYKSLSGFQKLAELVGGPSVRRFENESVYRVFADVEYLVLQQVGLLSGARSARYSMFTGTDVGDAIDRLLRGMSEKSNLYGTGFRDGTPVGIGCSKKGKIWSIEKGSILEWIEWCRGISTLLRNEDFDTSKILENTLIPQRVTSLPDNAPWFIELPGHLFTCSRTNSYFKSTSIEAPAHDFEITLLEYNRSEDNYSFSLAHANKPSLNTSFKLALTNDHPSGITIEQLSGPPLNFCHGKKIVGLVEYFKDYPPLLSFVDHSFLDGSNFIQSKHQEMHFDTDQIEPLDWMDTDITKESYWKNRFKVENSVQHRCFEFCEDDDFEIIFDDDGANEIADIVAIKDSDEGVIIRQIHCKYSSSPEPGARVADIEVVCAQAAKNAKLLWNFDLMVKEMQRRNSRRTSSGCSRYFKGSPPQLQKLLRLAKECKRLKFEIIVAQPGVAKHKLSTKMNEIFGSCDHYIRSRANCKLTIWSSE